METFSRFIAEMYGPLIVFGAAMILVSAVVLAVMRAIRAAI